MRVPRVAASPTAPLCKHSEAGSQAPASKWPQPLLLGQRAPGTVGGMGLKPQYPQEKARVGVQTRQPWDVPSRRGLRPTAALSHLFLPSLGATWWGDVIAQALL